MRIWLSLSRLSLPICLAHINATTHLDVHNDCVRTHPASTFSFRDTFFFLSYTSAPLCTLNVSTEVKEEARTAARSMFDNCIQQNIPSTIQQHIPSTIPSRWCFSRGESSSFRLLKQNMSKRRTPFGEGMMRSTYACLCAQLPSHTVTALRG